MFSVYLQKLASIQPRTSLSKFVNIDQKCKTVRTNIGYTIELPDGEVALKTARLTIMVFSISPFKAALIMLVCAQLFRETEFVYGRSGKNIFFNGTGSLSAVNFEFALSVNV